MIICLRHGDDDYSDATHRHDHRLTKKGERQITNRVKELLEKYGEPKIIYCSPFKRTKQSLKIILKMTGKNKPKIIFSKGLSKYFGRTLPEDASIFPETYQKDLPFYEDRDSFHKRVDEFCEELEENRYHEKNKIWCITHAIIYRRIAKYFGIEVEKNVPFAAAVKIGSSSKPLEKNFLKPLETPLEKVSKNSKPFFTEKRKKKSKKIKKSKMPPKGTVLAMMKNKF